MSWQTGYVSHHRCRLHYKFYADGPKPWAVLLHGFGQDWSAFDALYPLLLSSRNVLAINLFFHGESELEGNKPLEKKEWLELVERLMAKHAIDQADLIAYSMGCKFALFTAQILPSKVRSLTLLAPDGVVMNPWYRLATRTWIGRISCQLLLFSRGPLLVLAEVLGLLGLVKPAVIKFAKHQLRNKSQRDLVVHVWLRFRHIWPNWQSLAHILQKEPIPTTIILGKYDAIIPVKKFTKVKNQWDFIRWLTLSAGHSNLVEQTATEIENRKLHLFNG